MLEESDGKWIVHVLGDIDLSCASEFENAIDEAASRGGAVVVDLRDCRYMDSTGLTALIRAVKRYGALVEAMVSENSPVSRVVRVTGFDDVLPIAFV